MWGFRMLQTRMKCMDNRSYARRAGFSPGETKEVHGQDALHSVESFHTIDHTTPCRADRSGQPDTERRQGK